MKLSVDEIKKFVSYNPEDGNFYRVPKLKKAGWKHPSGYRYLIINGVTFSEHRLAWFVTHGSIDENLVIDHINGKRGDNRLVNLRQVTVTENNKNCGVKHTESKLQQFLKNQGKPLDNTLTFG
jgi:hypothetical protein